MALLLALPVAARSDEAMATLTGTVQTTSGAPVANAQLSVNGPKHANATSDAAGHFTLSLPPGIYRLDANKGGYVPTSVDDIVLVNGQTQTLTLTLTVADLNSLKTITRVSVSRGRSINTGAASTYTVTASSMRDFAFPQISNIVQTIPGAAIQRGSSNPNVEISVAGSQPYETQTLVDGHPLATGRTGTFYVQFINQYIIQGLESQLGPGNTTPFAGTAVGGTVNILTPGFSTKPMYSYVQGIDTTGSLYSNWLASEKFNRLSFVADYASGGYDGPFFGRNACVLAPQNKSTWNTPAATGIITFCGNVGSALRSKGEILKVKYDLSNATSFEAGFIGSQSGYFPQNITYGVDAGNVNIVSNINGKQYSSPFQQQYIGAQTHAYFFYPGSNVYYNVPLFEGQLRTAIGSDTLLVRPYAGAITRDIDGSGEANYPAFWFPTSQGTAPGSAGYLYCQSQEDAGKQAPAGYNYFGPTANGLTACNQTPYSTYEHDVLHGTTFSYIHPFGANDVTATYDYHSDQSFSNVGNFAGSPQVPAGTIAKYNLLSLTGNFGLGQNVRAKAGLYYNNWHMTGTTTISQTVTGTTVNAISGPLSTSVSRFDPHIALTWSPRNGSSYRFSAGTSTTFPYALLVSGNTSVLQASGTGSAYPTFVQKNPNLAPERATEFDLGMDHRFANGGIFTLDLLNNNISNVFETISVTVPNAQLPQGFENISQPINAANLANKLAVLGYRFMPTRGFGYFANLTFARSVVNGIPWNFYPSSATSFGVPANGVQQCADASGNTVCVPYIKAYANGNYTFSDGSYVGLGADFEGKNNTYYQPPLVIWDLAVKHPINSNLEGQISIYNLLNTNNFGNLPTPNAGVAPIGMNGSGQLGQYKSSSLQYPLIPVQQRTAYFQLRFHLGDQKP